MTPADPPAEPRAAVSSPPPPSTGGTKALIGVLLAGTVGLIIFLFVHLSKDGKLRPGAKVAHAECTKGQQDCLPDVNYVDTSGVAYTRDSLTGKVVLVNFWATWCRPCLAEIPDLSKIYEKYKDKGVVFLGVLTDSPDNNQLLNFQSDHDMRYPVVRSNSDLLVSYNYPDSLPTTYVFDRSGKRVLSRVGVMRERELDEMIARLAAEN